MEPQAGAAAAATTTTMSEHAAHVIKSHLCVLLFDVRSGPGEQPQAVWSRLRIFVNAYISKDRRNFVAVVLYGTAGVQIVYPTTQYLARRRQQQQQQQQQQQESATNTKPSGAAAAAAGGDTADGPEAAYVPWTALAWPVRARELNAQMDLFPQHFPVSRKGGAGPPAASLTASLSVALSLANKFLLNQQRNGVRSTARVLLVHRNSPYRAKEYLAMMNCIFCAEKLRIPIDACALTYDRPAGGGSGGGGGGGADGGGGSGSGGGSSKLETLTQAASITNGLYFELAASQHDALLQWLFTIFFAHRERRDLVSE